MKENNKSQSNTTVIAPTESGHSVSLDGMPREVWEAMIAKLNEKSQSFARTYTKSYQIQLEDIRHLFRSVEAQFASCKKISANISVSLFLSDNQKIDFRTWEDFEVFDRSIPESTRSISVEMVYDVYRLPDGRPERYSIEVSIQNNPSEFGFSLGPISIVRASRMSAPPVPIFCTVECANFTLGQNILNAIDAWEKSLKRQENFIVDKLQPISHRIRKGLVYLAFLSALSGVYLFAPQGELSNSMQLEFVALSVIAVTILFGTASIASSMVEKSIDRHQSLRNFSLTKGDRNSDATREEKNKRLSMKAAMLLGFVVFQIIVSIMGEVIAGRFIG